MLIKYLWYVQLSLRWFCKPTKCSFSILKPLWFVAIPPSVPSVEADRSSCVISVANSFEITSTHSSSSWLAKLRIPFTCESKSSRIRFPSVTKLNRSFNLIDVSRNEKRVLAASRVAGARSDEIFSELQAPSSLLLSHISMSLFNAECISLLWLSYVLRVPKRNVLLPSHRKFQKFFSVSESYWFERGSQADIQGKRGLF